MIQIRLFPLDQKEITHHASKLTIQMIIISIPQFFLDILWIILTNSYVQILVVISQMLCIYQIYLFFLVDRVKHLEDLLAEQLVISIQYHQDLIVVAIFMDRVVYVFQGTFLCCLMDQDEFRRVCLSVFQVFAQQFCGSIWISIDGNDGLIIYIFLMEDRFYIFKISMRLFILVTRNDQANRQLFILIHMISLFQSNLLIFHQDLFIRTCCDIQICIHAKMSYRLEELIIGYLMFLVYVACFILVLLFIFIVEGILYLLFLLMNFGKDLVYIFVVVGIQSGFVPLDDLHCLFILLENLFYLSIFIAERQGICQIFVVYFTKFLYR